MEILVYFELSVKKGKDILIWRLWIALCGGIILEEALGLSSNRILNEWMNEWMNSYIAACFNSKGIIVSKSSQNI